MGYARLIRGQVLKVREYDFVQAARALGASDARILLYPYPAKRDSAIDRSGQPGNGRSSLVGSVVVISRPGVPPPAPSWGVMIEEARDLSTLQAAPHALIFPGIAIALTVLAFNFIGDGLREYLDPAATCPLSSLLQFRLMLSSNDAKNFKILFRVFLGVLLGVRYLRRLHVQPGLAFKNGNPVTTSLIETRASEARARGEATKA